MRSRRSVAILAAAVVALLSGLPSMAVAHDWKEYRQPDFVEVVRFHGAIVDAELLASRIDPARLVAEYKYRPLHADAR